MSRAASIDCLEDIQGSVPEWMRKALKMNPPYTFWGNYEDYMMKSGGGWDSRQFINTASELWELDDLNEVVNFYFDVIDDSDSETRGINKCHLELQLWVLHPRKGCSRGLRLLKVEESDMPTCIEYLKEAALRNQSRFQKIFDAV